MEDFFFFLWFEYKSLFCVSLQLGLHHVVRTSMFVLEGGVCRLANAVMDRTTVQTDLMRSVGYIQRIYTVFQLFWSRQWKSVGSKLYENCYNLLILMKFQTCMALFLIKHVKYKIFSAVFINIMEVNGVQNSQAPKRT